MKNYAISIFKFIAFMLVFATAASPAWTAPIVVTPGESSSYVYFPAGVTTAVGGGTTSGLVGMVAAFPKTPPAEWLECDGSTIQASSYPELVKYLAGAAATSATLPDYRGYFLRGWDHLAGRDAGRALNTTQGYAIQSHAHTGTANAPAATSGTTANSPAVSSSATTSANGGHGHGIPLGTDTASAGQRPAEAVITPRLAPPGLMRLPTIHIQLPLRCRPTITLSRCPATLIR